MLSAQRMRDALSIDGIGFKSLAVTGFGSERL